MHRHALYSSALLAICDSRTRRAAATTPRRHAVGKERRETRGRFDRSHYPRPRRTLNDYRKITVRREQSADGRVR